MKDQVRDYIAAGEFTLALDVLEANGMDFKAFRSRLEAIDAIVEKAVLQNRTLTTEEYDELTDLEISFAKDILSSLRQP